MSLFKESVEVSNLKARVEELEKVLWIERQNRQLDGQWNDVKIENARTELRKEMEQALIESDLKRVEAVSSLKAYKEMDNKDDRKHIRTMLADAIESLGVKSDIVVQK